MLQDQHDALSERRGVDTRQGRWLPRHQPWNASSAPVVGAPRSLDALSAQLDELGEPREAGLLTDEQFVHQRAWLLALTPPGPRTEPPPPGGR